MKKIILSYYLNVLLLLFLSSITFAQVGINTVDPKGVLDLNSTTSGIVYPNVALVATNDPSPVVNPQGGSLVVGTVVYNTNSTDTNALTDVSPGIYVWDGSDWIIHFKKRQSELHDQTSVLRTEATGGFEDIPGLGVSDAKTFTAKYSGLYRVQVKTIFGAGRTENNSSTFVSLASGQFRFLFGATPAMTFETEAYSAYSSYIAGGSYFEAISKETYETYYVTLVAGTTYPFSLSFDAYDAPGFIGNGSTTAGTPSSVDLINEDFDPSYTIIQTNTTDTDCPVDGWQINNINPCTSCVNNHLYIDSTSNNCEQNATASMSFTPSVASVDISFDYRFLERNPGEDRFRVYLHDGTNPVTPNLVNIILGANTSYTGTVSVTPGLTYTLNFEYISLGKGNYASVDNVIVSELSGPLGSPSDLGRGYVGNGVDCQIEFTYIGE